MMLLVTWPARRGRIGAVRRGLGARASIEGASHDRVGIPGRSLPRGTTRRLMHGFAISGPGRGVSPSTRDHLAEGRSGKHRALPVREDVHPHPRRVHHRVHRPGAHPSIWARTTSSWARRDVRDTALVLGSMFDDEFRGFKQEHVEIWRSTAAPVRNGLTDKEHPTQMLADFMTMKENLGTPVEGLTLAYCGQDATTCRTPHDHQRHPGRELRERHRRPNPEPDRHRRGGAGLRRRERRWAITVTNDPVEAVENADAICTNVGGHGEESQFAERVKLMSPLPGERRAAVPCEEPGPHLPALPCRPSITWEHRVRRRYGRALRRRRMEVTDEVFSDHGRQRSSRLRTACTPSRPSWRPPWAICTSCV